MRQASALNTLSKKVAANWSADKGKKLKAVRPLASLLTFTLIYRYITPVLITPLANKLGNKINSKHAEMQGKEDSTIANSNEQGEKTEKAVA